MPDYPADLFAAAALLLETAGAYHYLVPDEPHDGWGGAALFLDPAEHARWVQAGRNWLVNVNIPQEVERLWNDVGSHSGSPVFVEHRPGAAPEGWWVPALGLLIVADEACADLGYGATRQFAEDMSRHASWVYNVWRSSQQRVYLEVIEKARRTAANHVTFVPQESTTCLRADPDVACVQPKSRTPAMGCTLRTLSHNVALLPPRGVVRASWQRPPWPLVSDDDAALNLLLIPYPFHVTAQGFKGRVRLHPDDARVLGPDAKPWGWFDLEQSWLGTGGSPDGDERRKALVDFTIRLAETAMHDVGKLHGIVFPELALDWSVFEDVAKAILARIPSIEFLVSGSSNNCKGEAANVALSTVFTRGTGADALMISTSRSKHHRWRLDETQVSTYALASALDPRVTWWERAILPKREIHVSVFRESSTFATMICEDLARVDPCHTVLRSVAPSLVFVLLMDGPQIAERWPSRYATVLADDPGSSVLTLTSLALIERANRTGRRDGSRSVALWKEDTGKMVAIPCPENHHGIVLTLSGSRTTEVTLDGRANRDGRAWRFHGQQPVKFVPRDTSETRILDLVTGKI